MANAKVEEIRELNSILHEVQSAHSELSTYILSADYSTYVIRSRLDQITLRLKDIVEELSIILSDHLENVGSAVGSTMQFIIDNCTNNVINLGYLYRRDTKVAEFPQKKI